jgi:hypothetical protein
MFEQATDERQAFMPVAQNEPERCWYPFLEVMWSRGHSLQAKSSNFVPFLRDSIAFFYERMNPDRICICDDYACPVAAASLSKVF